MLNLAACRSKTVRGPAGAPCCEKPSRDKALMQGRSLRYRQAYETSRYMLGDCRTPKYNHDEPRTLTFKVIPPPRIHASRIQVPYGLRMWSHQG